jgi:hypothetical protein
VIDAEVPDPGRPFGVTLRRNWMPTPMQAAFLAELESSAAGSGGLSSGAPPDATAPS